MLLIYISAFTKLKGGDSLLYHALKLYKLQPALHWSAGGYIWPIDRPVEIFSEEPTAAGRVNGSPQLPPMRGAFSNYASVGVGAGAVDTLRVRVEESGAVPLAGAEVTLLTDWRAPEGGPVGKARVHFVEGGLLEKLVVNVLLVVFVL